MGGSVNDEDVVDEVLSPLLATKQRASRKSESPRCRPGETPEHFAHRMLLACKRIAREARNDGENLYVSDSSASPVKRRHSWNISSAPASPTKRRTVGDACVDLPPKTNKLWEPVYARRIPLSSRQMRAEAALIKESTCPPSIDGGAG